MKFRIFLAVVCLAFVVGVLSYGADTWSQMNDVPPTPVPTPIVIDDLPESLSCGDEILFDNRPLVAGFVGRPASLLPFSQGPRSQLENDLSGVLFRGLVRIDENGTPKPDLASWQLSEDGLNVTFSLDQGAVWHDGTPVSAADVAFTASTLATGLYNTPVSFPWNSVSTTVIDAATVQMSLPIPFSPFLEAATVGLLPAHVGIDPQNVAGSPFAAKPVGNGNFRVMNEWESDGLLYLAAIQSGFLSNLEIRFYPSIEALTVDLQTHDLDLAIYPPNTPISAVGAFEVDELNLFSSPADQSTQLFFKMDDGGTDPISDPVVRQALRLSLDRQSLIDSAASGQGLLVEGPWDYDNRFQDSLELRLIRPDLDAATTVLNDAGWVIPEEGTVFQKDGVELSINLITTNQANYGTLAIEMARQWTEFGIVVNVETVDPANYQAAIAQRNFDATVQKVNLSADPDLYDFWSQEAIVRGQNFSRWNDRSSSEALEAGRQTWEDELRAPFYKAFSSFFERELPAMTLYQDVRLFAMNGNVRGQMVGTPADLTELLTPFPQWVILSSEVGEGCDQN